MRARSMTLGLLLSAHLLACRGGGDAPPPPQPPSALAYATSPAFYTVGVTITPNRPSSRGGPVTAYSVTPPLPPGLGLDAVTGVISGTPTALSAMTSYLVTASSALGSADAAVGIAVNDAPPANLAYGTDPAVYPVGVPIAPNDPASGGGAVVSYAVAPSLPPGLELDRSTGRITGIPTTVAPAAASW